jgi:hypothetical protein
MVFRLEAKLMFISYETHMRLENEWLEMRLGAQGPCQTTSVPMSQFYRNAAAPDVRGEGVAAILGRTSLRGDDTSEKWK